MHFLLFYDVVEEYVERRRPFRGAHLTHAQPYVARGELLLGGALDDPVDGAVLLFEAPGPGLVESFARADPYVQQGLVTRWQVRPWLTVAGSLAAAPLAPSDV
ncbi:MAG TPA: YciI-like protein [Gemmatimonadales bacterium]|nr:YciI-like protein [Gemmatimonadales bacterium]